MAAQSKKRSRLGGLLPHPLLQKVPPLHSQGVAGEVERIAEAIAQALMVPLLVVRYDYLIGSYLGETTQRLRKLFDFVRSRACVLFLDEFDTLGKERGDIRETGEIKRVVSSLLLQIDNLPTHFVIVTATNHLELLDKLLQDNGQF